MKVTRTSLPKCVARHSRKRFANVEIAREGVVHAYGLMWSGGSKSTYSQVSLATGEGSVPEEVVNLHGIQDRGVYAIPPGSVILETGWFCGKPATMVVYVLPQDVAPFLPALLRMQLPTHLPLPVLADWLEEHGHDRKALQVRALAGQGTVVA